MDKGKCGAFYCKEKQEWLCCRECDDKCLSCCYNSPKYCNMYVAQESAKEEVKDEQS